MELFLDWEMIERVMDVLFYHTSAFITQSATEPLDIRNLQLGIEYAEEKATEASKRWALRRLKQLGYQVTLQPTECA